MSESTSAPNVSPTPATPQPATPGVSPGTLSIREAAQVLGRRRHEAAGRPPGSAPDGAQAPAAPRPAPNDVAAQAGSTEPAEDAPRVDSKPDALAAALGQPGQGEAPSQESTPGAPTSYEIDGRSYAADDLRKAIAEYGDYTKKTQTLAAQQKQVTEQAQQLRALHEQHKAFETVLPLLQPELNRLAQSFQMVPPPASALLQSDPTAYLQQLAAHNDSRAELDRLQQIMGVQTAAGQRHQAAAEERSNQVLSEKYPVWRDPVQRGELQKQIVEWATTKGGFNHQELRSLTDHRHLEALMKAAMYDRLSEGAKARAPTQMTPARGAAPPPPRPAALREAEARFSEKPNVRSAAALLGIRRAQGR